VTIVEIRLGDGLGGKGITSLTGTVQDVQAAIAAGAASANQPEVAVQSVVIPRQHVDLRQRLDRSSRFSEGLQDGIVKD
jgi:microcompartment protein CcmL/EutN